MRAIKLRRVCSSGFFCAGRAHGIFRPRTRTFRHPRTRHTCIMHTQREVRAKVRTYVVCASAPHIGAIISHRSSAYIIYLLRRALSQLSALHAEPASQPAEITFQWFRGFQWFLTARARACGVSSAFQSFANYRAELRKPMVHRALQRERERFRKL